MNKKYFIPIMLMVYLVSCSSEQQKTMKKLREEPACRLESYEENLQVPLEDRVFDAPDFLIDYLKRMDNTERYKAYAISQDDRDMVKKCIEELPKKIKGVLDTKLFGIFFVDKFIGAGMCDSVFDRKGALYSIIILNSRILKVSMSNWMNYRDNSIFNKTANITVKSICKPNNPQLLQTLVHEISHVYDYHMHVTPYTDPQLAIFKKSDSTPFIDNVWESYYTPVKEYNFRNRNNISFYGLGRRKVDNSYAAELYRDLSNTPFSSMYGSLSWGEDFAEAFTWFYLWKRFGIEYKVNVYRNKTLLVEFSPSKNKIVKQRSRILEELMD